MLYSPASGPHSWPSSEALFRRTLLPEGDSRTPVLDDPDHQPWTRFRNELRASVPEHSWDVYLCDLELSSTSSTDLVLKAPAQHRDFIHARYARLLHACAEAAFGRPVNVTVVHQGTGDLPEPAAMTASAAPSRSGLPPNPRLTFDQFVIGSCNQFAHAAALTVAEMPGLTYNPLYICGAPGLGKSHLLHSVANYAADHGDNLAIQLTTAETFTNEFLGALRGSGDMAAFKDAHRGVDLLLVDDVQFLQSKARTEQEFFHLFNELHQSGVQIVLTSDRPPRDLDALEARLRERFEAGLVCEVLAPDVGTRMTVLRKRVLQDDLDPIDPAALEAIAERVHDNVRALEGALIRVVAFASLTGREVTPALAEEVLGTQYPLSTPPRSSIEDIQERVCAAFGITRDQMLSATRMPAIARARQLAMFLARELTGESLPAIAAAFGARSHTTVLHAYRKVSQRLPADTETAQLVDRITADIAGL